MVQITITLDIQQTEQGHTGLEWQGKEMKTDISKYK